MKTKKLMIGLVLVLLLLPSVLAVTKPVRGFVKESVGEIITGQEIEVGVKIHAGLAEDYVCYCYARSVYTNEQGEFVQDLGNLQYREDCSFWSKAEGDDCSNDWLETDLINLEIKGRNLVTKYEVIGTSPIYEFGNVFLNGMTVSRDEQVALVYEKNELPGKSTEAEMKLDDLLKVKKINLIYDEEKEKFVLLVVVENQKSVAVEALKLKILIKDVGGQERDSLESPYFNLAARETKEIKIEYDVEKLEGVNLITAELYQEDTLLAASATVEVIIYEPGNGLPFIVLKPGPGESNGWLLWGFLGLVLLILLVLFFEIVIIRRGKKRNE